MDAHLLIYLVLIYIFQFPPLHMRLLLGSFAHNACSATVDSNRALIAWNFECPGRRDTSSYRPSRHATILNATRFERTRPHSVQARRAASACHSVHFSRKISVVLGRPCNTQYVVSGKRETSRIAAVARL